MQPQETEAILLAALERDSNKKGRNIAVLWTVITSFGALAMFAILTWPQLQSTGNEVIQTRVAWFGSTTLGWVYVWAVPIGLAAVAIRVGTLAARHHQKLRSVVKT